MTTTTTTTPTTTTDAPALELGGLYRMASGLGGVFDVHLVGLGVLGALVRVHAPANPDWHGYTFTTAREALRPLPVRWQVRTRLTNGGASFAVWETCATPEAAGRALAGAQRWSKGPFAVVRGVG